MIVLILIGLLAQVSPLVLFFIFFKKNKKIVELKVIFYYVVLSLISVLILGAFKNYANQMISIFAICECIFFSTLLYLCIKSRTFKMIVLITSIVTLITEAILFSVLKSNFDFWVALLNAIPIVIYSIFYFYEQINSLQASAIYESYKFWLVTGCIIYLSGTLFLFLYTSDLKDKAKSSWWEINIAFEIIKNICFSVAFAIARKNKEIEMSEDFGNTNMPEKAF